MKGSPTDAEDVVVVTSRPLPDGSRAFVVLTPEPGAAPELPADLSHEGELVRAMEEAGYRLSMVGGGSRIDEVRRFYFRKPTGGSSGRAL